MPLTPEESKLTPEELKKDVQMRLAESVLKQIEPNLEFQWVKKGQMQSAGAQLAGSRRIIQMEG